MGEGSPPDRPIGAHSRLPLFTLDDVGTMRRLAAGPLAWHPLIRWRGHGDEVQYLERCGMVRISYDWERSAPVAQLTHAAALWLASDMARERDSLHHGGRRRVSSGAGGAPRASA
jgi:hypothetical protein